MTELEIWDSKENAIQRANIFVNLSEKKIVAEGVEETVLFEHFAPYKLD